MSIVEEKVSKYSFKVKNFTKDFYGALYSKSFCFAEGEWYVNVDAGNDNPDYIGIFLYKNNGDSVNVRFKISIFVEEKVIGTAAFTYSYQKNKGYGFPNFIARADLIKKISPHFAFIVVCEVQFIDDLKFYSSEELKIPSQLRDVCDKDFHDLKIQMKDSDQILSAHRFLLSAYSTVLYEEILKLGGSDYLKMENFSFETVQEILNFIYGKKVNKTDENVKEILLAAKKYEIENLQIECEKFIFHKVTDENAFENLTFAYENDVTILLKEIVSLADKNLDDLLKNHKTQWEQVVAKNPRIIKILFQEFMTSRSEKFKNSTTTAEHSETKKSSSNIDHSFLAKNYEYLFDSMEFSDVVLEVEGKELKAHKCILISQSTVFRAMFTHDTLESKENLIKIIDIDYDTMKQLLQFIYCGKVSLSDLKENPINLFSAADKYNLMDLKSLCKNSMEQNVTVKNVTEILKLADLHSSYLDRLKEIALNFFKKNFESVFVTTDWDNFAESNARILSDMLIKFMDDLK